jgi:hypothetical protein
MFPKTMRMGETPMLLSDIDIIGTRSPAATAAFVHASD